MMEYTPLNIFVREIVNGTMALSAWLVLCVFARYVWRHKTSLRHNNTVQAGLAIMILMAGHFARAASSWVEFILLGSGFDTDEWLRWTWIWFMLAFAGIITGKILMVKMFAPREWRNALIFLGIPACALIPILIAVRML